MADHRYLPLRHRQDNSASIGRLRPPRHYTYMPHSQLMPVIDMMISYDPCNYSTRTFLCIHPHTYIPGNRFVIVVFVSSFNMAVHPGPNSIYTTTVVLDDDGGARQTDRQTAARHQQLLSSSASANPTVPFFPTSDCVALVHSATLTVDFPELGARTVRRGDDNPEPETERGAHLPQAGGRGGAIITGNFDLFFWQLLRGAVYKYCKEQKKPH